MRPNPRPPWSYRENPDVPDFDGSFILVVMDGDCEICSATARRIARLDREDRVRICTAQSPLGRALLGHYDLSPDDPDSWLMLREGVALGSMEAIVALFPMLHWGFAPLRMLGLLPYGVQDWLYARIARNRYHFGKTDLCAMPDEELRRRLVS